MSERKKNKPRLIIPGLLNLVAGARNVFYRYFETYQKVLKIPFFRLEKRKSRNNWHF